MRIKQNRPGKEIVQLLKKGTTPQDIISKLKVNGATVTYWRKKLGFPVAGKGRPFLKNGEHGKGFNFKVRKLVKKMRREGRTFTEIGAALGVGRQRAHQYFWTAD